MNKGLRVSKGIQLHISTLKFLKFRSARKTSGLQSSEEPHAKFFIRANEDKTSNFQSSVQMDW